MLLLFKLLGEDAKGKEKYAWRATPLLYALFSSFFIHLFINFQSCSDLVRFELWTMINFFHPGLLFSIRSNNDNNYHIGYLYEKKLPYRQGMFLYVLVSMFHGIKGFREGKVWVYMKWCRWWHIFEAKLWPLWQWLIELLQNLRFSSVLAS